MMYGAKLAHPTRSPLKSIVVLDAPSYKAATVTDSCWSTTKSTKLKIIVNTFDVFVDNSELFIVPHVPSHTTTS